MRSMTHGPVMLDLRGTELQPDERDLLLHPATGGVILFARNYASPDQLYRLVQSIHELRAPSLIVAADQEGGRVQRFRDGMTRLPAPASALDSATLWRYVITLTFSSVTRPSVMSSSRKGRKDSMRSSPSTISTTIGRSSESRRILLV